MREWVRPSADEVRVWLLGRGVIVVVHGVGGMGVGGKQELVMGASIRPKVIAPRAAAGLTPEG